MRPVLARGPVLRGLLLGALLLAGCGGDEASPADGGALPSLDAAGTPDLLQWPCGSPLPRTRSRLRLLTAAEYDNTITDLFGVPSAWGRTFPAAVVVAGFDNNAAAGTVGDLMADKLMAAAEGIADEVVASHLARIVNCPNDDFTDQCARQFITTFGRRLFRRPVTPAERDAYYAGVYSQEADGFAEGIKWTLAAMLQSPAFLYRSELGGALARDGVVTLTDHEVASELSYLLWASTPDDALLDAADSGLLRTPAQIAAQVHRMFASPRARPMLDRFVTQWLKLDAVAYAPKDAMRYPDFTPAVRYDMARETRELFARVLQAGQLGGTLPSLLTTHEGFLTPELAAFYGLAGQPLETLDGGLGRWDLRGARRGGLLLGAPLAGQAKLAETAPVHRGKLVREQLLCQSLPAPPSGLNLDLPPIPPGGTRRDQFEAHGKNAQCVGCHELLDPIGLSLERYDAVGRYQELEGGRLIDDRGEIRKSPSSDGSYHGALELQALLAQSRDVSDCFATQWLRYGYGLREDDTTACLASAVGAAFSSGGQHLEPLLLALTQLPDFRQRLPDPAPSPAPDGGSP